MKLRVSDIKQTKFYGFLPKEFAYLNDGQYLSFYYNYDDEKSKIIDIKDIKVAKEITSLMYKGRPSTNIGIPYAIGGIASPFDTQHTFFYLFLKYYCEKDEQALKDLLEFFLKAKATDLESVEEKMKDTAFENSFEIVTRDNFCTAIDRYLSCNPQITTSVLTIVDTIDSYYRRINGKSIFYNCLEKIVTAVPLQRGGLMPERTGIFEYFYIGEKSELARDDKQLQLAKDMKREQFEISDIYAKTGWFFNAKDSKWRKLIDDSEAVLMGGVDLKAFKNNVIIPDKSNFVGQQDNMLWLMGGVNGVDSDDDGIAKKFNEGWDVVLGDILQHPTLYKNYPTLYNTPIFFGTNSKSIREVGAYTFYYSHAGFLVIMGNPADWDIKTVLLHEIQHRIQAIEGTSQGGSPDFADQIMSIGGENIKRYIWLRDKIVELFTAGATVAGKYSYPNYDKLVALDQQSFLDQLLIKKRTEKDYYKDISGACNNLIYAYLNHYRPDLRTSISDFFGSDVTSILKEINEILNKAENAKKIWFGRGYSPAEIKSIFFSMYESLGGEIESRDVQHTSVIDPELKGYLLPLTSEYVEEKKITSIFKGMFSGVPNDIKGGCENVGDGKYIIHLFGGGSPEPILHELGHILYDMVSAEALPLIKKNANELAELTDGNVSDVFTELLMCYLLKQDINPRFNRSISEGRKLMEYTFMDSIFDTIFNYKEGESDETDKKLLFMLSYMKKLNDSLDRTQPIADLPVLEIPDWFLTMDESIARMKKIDGNVQPQSWYERIAKEVILSHVYSTYNNYAEAISSGALTLDRVKEIIESTGTEITQDILNLIGTNSEVLKPVFAEIATNGKTTNLTTEQYRLVRTPAFKQWFGDWENNPGGSSKVIDENGEPLVVYKNQETLIEFYAIGAENKKGQNWTSKNTSIKKVYESVAGDRVYSIDDKKEATVIENKDSQLHLIFDDGTKGIRNFFLINSLTLKQKPDAEAFFLNIRIMGDESKNLVHSFSMQKDSGIKSGEFNYTTYSPNQVQSAKDIELVEEVETQAVETPKPKPILTYHCIYKGKTIEIVANSAYDAQLKAVPLLKANPKKSWEISVHLVAIDGVEQLQSTVFNQGGGIEFTPEKKGTLIKGNEIIKYFEKVNGNYRLVFYKLVESDGQRPVICDAFNYCKNIDANNVEPNELIELIKKNNLMEMAVSL